MLGVRYMYNTPLKSFYCCLCQTRRSQATERLKYVYVFIYMQHIFGL